MSLDYNSRATLAELFVGLIDDGIQRAATEPRRTYLGASMIGEPCLRRIQYGYLATPQDEGTELDARTRRIFHRGHQGEEWMAAWIRGAGFDLRTARKDGSQFGFEDCDGRFKGHIDGVIVGGPAGFAYPALWECKVMGAKGWKDLAKNGVAKARPHYAAQVATYQAYMQLAANPVFFTVLNADTMEIHLELVKFDQTLAQDCADKVATVLAACDHGETCPRVSDDAESFFCKWCPYKDRCWK